MADCPALVQGASASCSSEKSRLPVVTQEAQSAASEQGEQFRLGFELASLVCASATGRRHTGLFNLLRPHPL